MPSPPKTTDAAIVAAARRVIESRGRTGFTMTDVARAVGIRAPSLYNRFEDRDALLAAVELELWRSLERALAKAPLALPPALARDPVSALTAQADAYRSFAKTYSEGYALMFDAKARDSQDGVEARAAALQPTLPFFIALVGEADALYAARTLTPFLHGFVSMEIAKAFRLGGGPAHLDRAFERGVATILQGLAPRRKRGR